jgi:hypothetical protein
MTAYHQTRLFKWLVGHWLFCFLLMGLGFVCFGVASLNLVNLFSANASFLLAHGWTAVKDGGALQLLELIVNAYIAVAFYLLFKTCEHALVERLAHHHNH